jgi:hypothetical protein
VLTVQLASGTSNNNNTKAVVRNRTSAIVAES